LEDPHVASYNIIDFQNKSGKFVIGFGMKQAGHKPAILRARARDSSRGMPVAVPDSISRMRRSVSAFQAAATEGAAAP
jgi:hypothetical protein